MLGLPPEGTPAVTASGSGAAPTEQGEGGAVLSEAGEAAASRPGAVPARHLGVLSGMCFTPSVPLCHINNLCIHSSAVHFELYIYGTVHFS